MEHDIQLFANRILERLRGYLGVSEKDSQTKITSEDEFRLVLVFYIGFNFIMYFIFPFYIFLLWLAINIVVFFFLKVNLSPERPRPQFRGGYQYEQQETSTSTFFEDAFSGVFSKISQSPEDQKAAPVEQKKSSQKKPQETFVLKDSKRKVPKRSIYAARFPDSDHSSDSEREQSFKPNLQESQRISNERKREESPIQERVLCDEYVDFPSKKSSLNNKAKEQQKVESLGGVKENNKKEYGISSFEDLNQRNNDSSEVNAQVEENSKKAVKGSLNFVDILNKIQIRNPFVKKQVEKPKEQTEKLKEQKQPESSAMEIEEALPQTVPEKELKTLSGPIPIIKKSFWSKIPFFGKKSAQKEEIQVSDPIDSQKEGEPTNNTKTSGPDGENNNSAPNFPLIDKKAIEDPKLFYETVKNLSTQMLLEAAQKKNPQSGSQTQEKRDEKNIEESLKQSIEAFLMEKLIKNAKVAAEEQKKEELNENKNEGKNSPEEKLTKDPMQEEIDIPVKKAPQFELSSTLQNIKEIVKKPVQPSPLSVNFAARRNPLNRKVESSKTEKVQKKQTIEEPLQEPTQNPVVIEEQKSTQEPAQSLPVSQEQKNVQEPVQPNRITQEQKPLKGSSRAIRFDFDDEPESPQAIKGELEVILEKVSSESGDDKQNQLNYPQQSRQEEVSKFSSASYEKKPEFNNQTQSKERARTVSPFRFSVPQAFTQEKTEEKPQEISGLKLPEINLNREFSFGEHSNKQFEFNNKSKKESTNKSDTYEDIQTNPRHENNVPREENISFDERRQEREVGDENQRGGWDSLEKYLGPGSGINKQEDTNQQGEDNNYLTKIFQGSSIFSQGQTDQHPVNDEVHQSENDSWGDSVKQYNYQRQNEFRTRNLENDSSFANNNVDSNQPSLMSASKSTFKFNVSKNKGPVNYEEIYRKKSQLGL